jgi:hypothetical protein
MIVSKPDDRQATGILQACDDIRQGAGPENEAKWTMEGKQALNRGHADLRITNGSSKDKQKQKCKRGKRIIVFPVFYLERQKSLELSTSTLARLRSTN